jgi:hypothetical protein
MQVFVRSTPPMLVVVVRLLLDSSPQEDSTVISGGQCVCLVHCVCQRCVASVCTAHVGLYAPHRWGHGRAKQKGQNRGMGFLFRHGPGLYFPIPSCPPLTTSSLLPSPIFVCCGGGRLKPCWLPSGLEMGPSPSARHTRESKKQGVFVCTCMCMQHHTGHKRHACVGCRQPSVHMAPNEISELAAACGVMRWDDVHGMDGWLVQN